jgi:hypothetical protein
MARGASVASAASAAALVAHSVGVHPNLTLVEKSGFLSVGQKGQCRVHELGEYIVGQTGMSIQQRVMLGIVEGVWIVEQMQQNA